MSLLLEALKKAADAKRQQEEERIQRRTGQRLAITDEMLAEAGRQAPAAEELPHEPLELVEDERPASGDYRPPLSHAEAVAGYGEESIDTQRVARCVFDSKTPFAGERVRRVVYGVGAVGLVLGGLSMGGYAFYKERDTRLHGQLAGVRAALVRTAGAEADVEPEPAPPPAADVAAQAPVAAVPPAPVPTREPAAPAPAPAKPLAKAAPASKTRAAAPASATRPAVPARPDPPVNIVRNARRAQIGAALAAGFEAFQSARLDEAERHYGDALALDPDNRDALLGIGAVAVGRGDTGRAARVYTALLQRHPRDPVALAALAGLPGAGDPRALESELKVLLRTSPRAAELHFALGRLYSGERRWSQAQAAFFEAHRYDPDNPDFSFNLAVSLDHLGKRRQASRYYRAALAGAERRVVGFDKAAATRRLAALDATEGS